MALSKTQVDRLGERLKRATCSESDLRLLDGFRLSFDDAYRAVIRVVGDRGEIRSARIKTTQSIAEKLRRESIRLSQMQDIAGCRVIVANITEQGRFVESITTELAASYVIDRREKPSFGYRAVHVIAEVNGKPVEIQVRTWLQHLWAEFSEKLSDVVDPAIKHGGGPDLVRDFLAQTSKRIAIHEGREAWGGELLRKFSRAMNSPGHIPELIDQLFESMAGDDSKRRFGEHYPLLFLEWMRSKQENQLVSELTIQPPVPATPEEIDSGRRKELESLCQPAIEDTRRIIQDESNELDNLLSKMIGTVENLKRPNQ